MPSNINEVKSIIRGLLTSCAEEMTVGKLRHDYRDQEGHDIPFYEYKFHDVTSFLRSIPDVCQVIDNPFSVQPIVRLVESEKSAHISSLVMRQRPSNKRHRRSNVTVHGRLSYKLPHSSIKRSSKPAVYRISHSESSLGMTKPKPLLNVCAPEFNVRTAQPTISNPSPSVMSWDHEDQEISGNDESMIQSTVPISKEECEDSSVVELHLHQVLSNHEGVALHELEGYLKESLSSCGYNISLDKDKIEEILGRMVDFTIRDNKVFYINSCEIRTEEIFPEVTTFKNEEDMSSEMNKEDINNSSVEDNLIKGPSYPFIPSDGNDKVQRLERNLYSLIKDCPTGILLSELVEKYKLKFAAPLNLQILGCKTLNELVSKMKYIFSSVKLEDGDIKLFPTWLPNAQKLANKRMNYSESKKIDIPVLIKRNIQWLMQGYPNGLHSKEFKQTYKDTFYGEVDLAEMGFSTLLEFFNTLELEGIIQICISDSDTWLLPSKSPVEAVCIQDPLPLLSGESEEDMCILKAKFPIDVVGPDMHIEQEIIPSWVKRGSMIEIYIQELRNPHNFWVTFVGDECSAALETLMDDLQAFYCTKSHSYKMPYEVVRKGQLCATQYSGEWNRARVIRLVNSSEVEVLFFDYGTQSVVQGNALYFLHTSFSKLPAQAIRAVMANIAPIGATWSKDASKRFLSLIADRPLIGIVHNVDRQNCIFSLFLCDTNGNDDIYIGDVLVAEGYAREVRSNEECLGENLLNVEISDDDLSSKEAVDTIKTSITNDDLKSKEVKNDFLAGGDLLLLSPTETLCLENGVNHVESLPILDCVSPQEIQNKFDLPDPDVATLDNISNSNTDNMFTGLVSIAPKVAPPPGFCHSTKVKDLADKTDMFKSSDSLTTKKEEFIPCGINKEVLQPTTKTNNESSPTDMKYPTRSVNSGVNANFHEEFKTYPGNTTNYMGWSPPAYSTVPAFHPPFVPLDISARLPLTPLGYPFPNPIDFYSLWYYEHMRQQAIIRGALAHVNNVLPQLPGGLLILPNQTVRPQMYANNQMHISELNSPPLRVEKTESLASTISTQTEDLFDDTSAHLPESNVYKIGSSACKPETSPIIGEESAPLHRMNQSSKGLQTEMVSNIVPHAMFVKDDVETACKEGSGNQPEACNSYCISDKKVNNPVILEQKEISIESHSLHNSLLDELSNKYNAYKNWESQDSEQGKLLKCGGFQLPRSENDKGCGKGKSNCVKEISGENNTKDNADILEKNVHIMRDNIVEGNRKMYGRVGVSYNSTLSTEELQGNNPFIEGGFVDEKIISDPKVNEKDLTSKDTGVKCSNIVLNPFLTSLSEFEINRYNLQPITDKNVFNVELNPFGIKKEQTSGINILPNSDFTSQEKILPCSEVESSKSNDFALLLEKQSQQNCTENTSWKVLSTTKHYDNSVVDKPKFYSFDKLGGIGNVAQENQLEVRGTNEQNTISIERHHSNESSLELVDSLKNVSLEDRAKSAVSLNETEVKCSERNSYPPFDKSSVLLRNQGTCSLVEGVCSSKVHTELTEDRVRGHQVVSKVDQDPKSSTVLQKFPDKSLKRTGKTVTTDSLSNSCQNPGAVGTGGSVRDASHKTRNTQLPENTVSTWTTTWCTDKLAPKPPTKPTITDTFLQNSKKMGSMQSCDVTSLSRDDCKPRFVKKIKLLEHNIHLINMDGRPHVPTDEIVRNFTSFNGHHVILKILDARKIEINFLELCRKRRPDIFECLDKTDVKYVSRGLNGNIVGSLHTIPLRSIPYMLKALNRENSVISEAVQEALANFDPNDPYWKGRSK